MLKQNPLLDEKTWPLSLTNLFNVNIFVDGEKQSVAGKNFRLSFPLFERMTNSKE